MFTAQPLKRVIRMGRDDKYILDVLSLLAIDRHQFDVAMEFT